jgi:hypothetical protein
MLNFIQKIILRPTQCFILGLCLINATFAKDQMSYFDNLTLTGGNWFENFRQVQTNSSGSNQGFEVAPFFSAGIDYFFHEKWNLIPEVGWVVQREAQDSRISKNLFFIRADAAYYLQENLRLRLGTSLMILNISGNGGEQRLDNADTTETYFIPSERRTALNQTIDIGLEYIIDRISIRGQTYIYAWNESEERMYTFSLSLSYLLPIKELM